MFYQQLFLAVISVLYLTTFPFPEICYSGAIPQKEEDISSCAQDWEGQVISWQDGQECLEAVGEFLRTFLARLMVDLLGIFILIFPALL